MSAILEKLTEVMGDSDGDGNPLVWRPNLPESIDGKPLVSSMSELFFDFPYHRLPENQTIAFFMRPEAMIGMALFYLVSKEPLRMFRDSIGFSPKSEGFKNFVALHNLALAVFSAVTMWNSWIVVFSHLAQRGWFATYCDVEGTHWQSGLGAWATVFYISKYYEVSTVVVWTTAQGIFACASGSVFSFFLLLTISLHRFFQFMDTW